MSGSSIQGFCGNIGAEASASGCQRVGLSQGGALGAIVFNQVNNLDQLGEVELPTLYPSFRRNELPPPSENVIKCCFTLKQCPLPKGSPEDALHDGMYHLKKGIDFDGSAEHSVQRMSSPTAMVGATAFPSSSRGLSAIAKEYLNQAPILYEEFLTGGLSQHIEEDEDPDLRYTLVRHALLGPSLGESQRAFSSRNPSTGHTQATLVVLKTYKLVTSLIFLEFCLAFSGVDFASWRAEELLVLIGESVSILRQAERDSTLSVYIDLAN
ncbi:hypothetical protein ACOSQ3_003060 [Xanthoceras sorbifolium]